MTVPLPMLQQGYELRYSGGGNGKINEMLGRWLYYTSKNSSPKINLYDDRNQRNLNTRRGNERIWDWTVTEQKEPGSSVKAFETGVIFPYLHLLHYKTNSCFQLHASQWLTLSSPWGLCLLGDWRREENQKGWLRLGHYKLRYLYSVMP